MRNIQNYGNIYVIIGLLVLLFGISKFMFQIVLIIGGFILINAGLRMQGKPSSFWYIQHWLSQLE
ncbi:MAG: hypothetical protein WA432_03010 [Candidatus Babeliaceae bacterium]